MNKTITNQTNNTTKGEKTMTTITFNKADIEVIQGATKQISEAMKTKMGITAPTLHTFLGVDVEELVVDSKKASFIVTKRGKKVMLPFSKKEAKELISLLTLQLPNHFPAFKDTNQFKALEEMDLSSRLTEKAKVQGKKTRETIVVGMIKMEDVYVAKEGKVLGKLSELSVEDATSVLLEGNKKDGFTKKENVSFVAFKDIKVEDLDSQDTFYQKMSGSLAMDRLSKGLGRLVEEVKIKKEISVDGMKLSINEPQNLLVIDEVVVLDGSGHLPFEDFNDDVLKAVFSEIKVAQLKEEPTEGVEVGEVFKTYNAYSKSMSQARSGGAFAFDSEDSIVQYLKSTGQDYRAYGKEKDGKISVDVSKAYKRFMLGASNGLKASNGYLASFEEDHKVARFTKKTEAGLEYEVVQLTNSKGQKYTIALVDDFYSILDNDQRFLLNVLDHSNAMVGVEEFRHWNNENAVKNLLKRNLTDGGGFVDSTTVNCLRKENIINSFDSFQLRVSHTIKGAVIQFDDICNLFGANMVLTEGMVKANRIEDDLRENGFQLFVVGQRKDGEDGVWIASQATQQMGLTASGIKKAIDNSVDFVRSAINDRVPEDLLAMLDASDQEEEGEFDVVDYIRLAKEFTDVLDEQYIKDQAIQAAVTKLNKLLEGKLFAKNARVRYMFTDPLAIYNAAKEGRYEVQKSDAVLGINEVITPSKKDNEYFMQTGNALSVRFPVTVTHEIPVVSAVEKDAYSKHVEAGLWQGCTFFDAFSWTVAQQAGADFDGDTSIIIFDKVFVDSKLEVFNESFGDLPVLPFIDAYVKYDNGVAVEFDEGSPTYVPADKVEVEEEVRVVNGFEVVGNTITLDSDEMNNPAREKDFFRTMAELSKEITVGSIETSLIGLIANRAMITTDLLTRSVLTPSQKSEVRRDLLILTTAGRWEIDRPKHGGAYLEMPLIENLFSKYEGLYFSKEELRLSDHDKQMILIQKKGVYANIFGPVYKNIKGERVLSGFRVRKPQWLASQKDEFGITYKDSLFQSAFGVQVKETDHLSYSEAVIQSFCEENDKPGTNSNNIRGRVMHNMEVPVTILEQTKMEVANVYQAYRMKEDNRRNSENAFRFQATEKLKEAGVFSGKDMDSLTKAKVSAKIRKSYKKEMKQFSMARELFQAEFRKEMYLLGLKLGLDIRSLVGALYLVINEMKTNGKTSFRKDGKEFRFSSSNGYIAIPFEIFSEEMGSLISGRVSETFFSPQDTNFTLLQSTLIEKQVNTTASSFDAVKVRVLQPSQKLAGKTVSVGRGVKVAIKLEEQKGQVRPVMYFLNKGTEVSELDKVTRDHAAYIGFAPSNAMIGIYEMNVDSISFDNTGQVATVSLA